MIQYAIFSIIAVCIVNAAPVDDIHFTLTMPDGTIVTGGNAKFHAILKDMYDTLESVPGYEERLDKGYETMERAINEAVSAGNRDVALMEISNIFWDMYEEMFEAAGMKLNVTNRQPWHN